MARTKEKVELTFYHMLSKIEIAIVRGDGAPELADDNAVTIADVVTNGTFKPTKEADMTGQTARQAMIEAGNTKEQMLISHRTCTNFEKTNVDYNEAIIVPQDMVNKVITFNLKNGGTLSYTIPAFANSNNAVFESGKKYIYHITLNLTGVEVSAKIMDWGNDGKPTIGNAEME